MEKLSAKEKLAKSLTAEDINLIEYLPYLLQDLWDLGSSPEDIMELLSEHAEITKASKILDLACGKGAVSVKLAEKFLCKVTGIDIMEDFIEYAKQKSKEHNVESLCKYITGDVNILMKKQKGFDVVIFGAVGDVLGNPEETLIKLSDTIKPAGYIVIDDAYGIPGNEHEYTTKEDWKNLIDKLGMKLVAEKIAASEDIANINNYQQPLIAKRAEELKVEHPDKKELFDSYVKSQLQECEEIENDLNCVTMLLKYN